MNNQKDDDFEEMTDDWGGGEFEKAMKDLRDARKLNRQAIILSVIALGINIIRIISIVIRSMA